MTRAAIIGLALVVAGCGKGGDAGKEEIDAAANEISAGAETLVSARVAEADERTAEENSTR